jgi:hypothetical protein
MTVLHIIYIIYILAYIQKNGGKEHRDLLHVSATYCGHLQGSVI